MRADLSSEPASEAGNWFYDTSSCQVTACACTDYVWNRASGAWDEL